MPDTRSQQATFSLIQLSLILGPLMFFGVTWFQHSQGEHHFTALPVGFDYALAVVFIIALAAVLYIRRARASITENGRFQTTTLMGWAAAEWAALFSIVYYWLTDQYTWALGGIGFLLLTAALLPAKLPQR
jgi:hypothetical protein